MSDIVAATLIGLFLGRLATFINGELWERPSDVLRAMVFPLPRHPSQLCEAALEGIVLSLLLFLLGRSRAVRARMA